MLMESLVPDYDAHGIVRERTAGSLLGVVPSGTYPTSDGHDVMVAGNSSGAFRRLMRLVDRCDLAEDPTLADADARWQREQEIETAIRSWTSRHSAREAVELLADAGVPAGPIYDARAITEDPHYAARGMLNAIELDIDGETQRVRFPGLVPRLPDAAGAIRSAGPRLGEHTEDLLQGLLGLNRTQIDDLRRDGVI